MDSPTKECNNPDEITTPAPVAESDVEDKTSEVAPEGNDEVKTSLEISSEHKSEDEDTTIESFEDIDLGSIEIAANMLEEMEKSLKPSEAYENLMGACSSTAQALKQTISDVLRTRESIVITDSTSELEQSLSQKIADFETVVSGSFVTRDIKAELTNIKHPAFSNVIITEVDDSTEDANISDTNSNAQVIEEQKSSPNNTSVELNSEAETLPENTEVSSKDSMEVSSKKIDEKLKSEVKSTQTLPVQGFLCPFCFVPFPTGDILHNHCETSHSENLCEAPIPSDGRKDVYICPACKVKLGSEIDLQSHYAKQHASEKNEAETVPVVNSAVDDKKFKKQQKANSNKKKGEKTIDQILKSLSNYSTPDEKLQALCKKHVEALEELRLMEPRMKQLERQVQSQQKEKEQLQADHNRMILAKSRLESLCRELQRQNKCVKEENLLRIKEEEEKRKEIANKFQSTLTDISALMQEHSKKNLQLREENAELAKKLKALVDHYDTWEKHMEKIVQQNHLEAQLAKAKHAKVNLVLKQETEKFLKEKQALLENMSELQKRCTLLTTNELKLRTELGDYTSKYEEFQTVLNKSSQVFASFKTDMEATSKKIKKLEKETNVYKQKWESSNNALLGMINDKQKHDKELINAQQRIATLEKLCRALQAERNELQNQLNAVTSSVNSSPNDVPPTPVET